MKSKLLLVVFTTLCFVANATTYYISASGNDANNGISISTPWKTISRVNSRSFFAGDSILFRNGDIWRETLVVPSSGSAGAYITFSSYGTGKLSRF